MRRLTSEAIPTLNLPMDGEVYSRKRLFTERQRELNRRTRRCKENKQLVLMDRSREQIPPDLMNSTLDRTDTAPARSARSKVMGLPSDYNVNPLESIASNLSMEVDQDNESEFVGKTAEPSGSGEWPEYLEVKKEPVVEEEEQSAESVDPLMLCPLEDEGSAPVKKEAADVEGRDSVVTISAAESSVSKSDELRGNNLWTKEETLDDEIGAEMELDEYCEIPSDNDLQRGISRSQSASTGSLKTTSNSGDMRFSCDFCDYKCRQVCHFKRHLRKHTGEKPYSCDYCSYRSADITTLRNHTRTHTGEKPYACEFCDSRFAQVGNLNSHLKTHRGLKPNSRKRKSSGVPVNPKVRTTNLNANEMTRLQSFETPSSVASSITNSCNIDEIPRLQSLDDPSSISLSNKTDGSTDEITSRVISAVYEGFKRLMESDTNESKRHQDPKSPSNLTASYSTTCSSDEIIRVEPSSIPSKVKTSKPGNLNTDEMMSSPSANSGSKTSCNATSSNTDEVRPFVVRGNATVEMTDFDAGEMRFSCDFCDYKCRQVCHFKRHMRKHTGEKPYSCSYCNYRCTETTTLKNHMRIHTGEKPYSCYFCDFKCIQIGNLKSHMKKHDCHEPHSRNDGVKPGGLSNPTMSTKTDCDSEEMTNLAISSVSSLLAERLQRPMTPSNPKVTPNNEMTHLRQSKDPSNLTFSVSNCMPEEMTRLQSSESPSNIISFAMFPDCTCTSDIVGLQPSCSMNDVSQSDATCSTKETTSPPISSVSRGSILPGSLSVKINSGNCHPAGVIGFQESGCPANDPPSNAKCKTNESTCPKSSDSPGLFTVRKPTDCNSDEIIWLRSPDSISNVTVSHPTNLDEEENIPSSHSATSSSSSNFKNDGSNSNYSDPDEIIWIESPDCPSDATRYNTKENSLKQSVESKQTVGNNSVMRFSCDFCDYKCRQVCHFKRHMMKHTGEKPYSCSFCDYRCADVTTLRNHTRTHTGEKPYTCDFCDYKCCQVGNLRFHLKKHHGYEPGPRNPKRKLCSGSSYQQVTDMDNDTDEMTSLVVSSVFQTLNGLHEGPKNMTART